MPIASTDILFRLSGGATNTNPAASLGGAESSTLAGSALFPDVTAGQCGTGDTEYRCIYVHNSNATITLQNAVIWMQSNTVSLATDIQIGLGTSAIGGVEQTVANVNTAPTGVTFSEPTTYTTGIAIGNLASGQTKAVWIRRVVVAQALASSDTYTIRVQGATVP